MQAVLADINEYERDGKLKEFAVRYVTAAGKRGQKARCRRGGVLKTEAGGKGGASVKLREKQLLYFHDLDQDRPFTIHRGLLTHFGSSLDKLMLVVH